VNKKHADANEQQEGQELGHRNHGDGTGSFTNAANVDQYEKTIHGEHHNNPHHRTAEERHHQGHGICQDVYHASNCAECREKIKHAGEKPDVAPKRHFDISVKTPGQRNTAAGDRETCDE